MVVGLEAGVDMTTTEEGVIMVSFGSSSGSLGSGSKVGAVRVSRPATSNLALFPTSEKKETKNVTLLCHIGSMSLNAPLLIQSITSLAPSGYLSPSLTYM